MSDITINSNENQEDNQKTTPVMKSLSEPNDSSLALSGEIFSTWLGMRDSNPRSWDQNPLPYRLANPQYAGYSSLDCSIELINSLEELHPI